MTLGLSPKPPQHQALPLIPQGVPVYRVTDEKGFFVDDRLLPEGTIIEWDEEPNPNMEPLNELAQGEMEKYLTKLDAEGLRKAQADGRGYTGLLDAYKNSIAVEHTIGRRAGVVGERPQVPLMAAKKGQPKAHEVSLDAPSTKPVLGRKGGKFSLNKTNGPVTSSGED